MNLNMLLKDIEIIDKIGNTDIDIKGLNYNSQKIKEDELFVAIKGFKTDGHKYIKSAIENGAKAVVLEDMPEETVEGVTYIKVADSRNCMAKLASEFFGNPSKELELIGLTGTNGKTTTSYILKSILEEDGRKVGLIGTIGNIIGDTLYETETTTPDSLELQESFRFMLDQGVDTAVMEVSSHALDLDRVAYTEFNIGIFTNLSVDHLDYHKNLMSYLDAKKKLFSLTTDMNIINFDDPYGKTILKDVCMIDNKRMKFGIEDESDIYATHVELKSEGVAFRLNTQRGYIKIHCKIPGIFTVYNCLAAASAAYTMNISLETIKKGIEKVEDVKGRFEVVPIDKDFTVIIDFAHTPDALEKVLKCVREFAKGRVVVVFGAGGDRDNSKRSTMGEVAGRYADLAIVTSDNPRTEDPDNIISQIIEGVEKVDGEYVSIVDRKEAIEYALENAKTDDVILLSGKGHENYIILGEMKYPFDERQIVLDALNK